MKRLIVITVVFLALTSCRNGSKTEITETEKQKDSLTTEINDFTKNGVFNGFAVSIVNDKGTLYQQGFGFADIKNKKKYTDSTIQNIASISKTFVGLALLKAQELGKLKLDDPINKYLPFKVVNPNFPENEITIRHLANHTSSMIDNEFYLTKNYFLKENQDLNGMNLVFDKTQVFNPKDSVVSMEMFLSNLLTAKGKWNTKEMYAKNKPGDMYEYSNIGTTLAAFVIEKATGETFDKFTTKHILKPLKMNSSGWHFEDIDFANYSKLYENPKTVLPFYSMVSYPDGNFITSINDLRNLKNFSKIKDIFQSAQDLDPTEREMLERLAKQLLDTRVQAWKKWQTVPRILVQMTAFFKRKKSLLSSSPLLLENKE